MQKIWQYIYPNPYPGETRSRFSILLTVWFIVSIIAPNFALAVTENYSIWTTEALILMPLGFYLMWSMVLRRSGLMIWLGFPFIFFGAFQLVLLYLFGNSIIATDMFTNLVTTNPGEANELLANIWPAVLMVAVIYLPLLYLAAREIGKRRIFSRKLRLIFSLTGAILFVLGAVALWPAYAVSKNKHVLRDEIFPLNVCYNVQLAASELRKTYNYDLTTEGFTFDAHRTASCSEREIYVYIIGEASRAMSWQLYGYDRETNPRLSRREDLILFKNVLTQSNTTHKSVPLFLSSINTHEHEELYRRRGLPALFGEAGFETWFISNQSPQGAMIDNLAGDVDHLIYLDDPRHDLQLREELERQINLSKSNKMLFILHCYGSHFSYHQRYPRSEAHFSPDPDVAIRRDHSEELRNGYDNSIRYTDLFLDETLDYLSSLDDTATALLYCADHGEDLMDDKRHRFLHASPTTTAYQLHVAAFCWFSERYRSRYPAKVMVAEGHTTAPATTHAMYHTMADMASIEGRFVEESSSLVSPDYDLTAPRRYLNDHNEAVPYSETGLSAEDIALLRNCGVEID